MGKLDILLIAIAFAVVFRSMLVDKNVVDRRIRLEQMEEVTNGATWSFSHWLLYLADLFGIPFGQYFISFLYGIYLRLTLLNMVIFLVKYVPTGIYMYRFIKTIYVTSHERLKQKQTELEDIQLKIQIVNTKLCVRDSEYTERADILRRRLRRVRARVRDVIAMDDSLSRALEAATDCDDDFGLPVNTQEDNDFTMELLKGLKDERIAIPDRLSDKLDCGEHAENDLTADHSVYSSLSDMDVRQDCRVKIVKVTNVYKVAYLKHYIKQKRLRRANKRALLNKKMESIKNLMEDWHRTLNMVINRSMLNLDMHPVDVASQEAMGDYSKARDCLSDTDMLCCNDGFIDDYSLNWAHPYRNYPYNYEDAPESAVCRKYFGDQDNGDVKPCVPCECVQRDPKMTAIVEETGSQMAIETSEGDDGDCRDLIAI